MKLQSSSGPLAGVRVVEFEGANPSSMCGMVLADLGASVICLTRPGEAEYEVPPEMQALRRGKQIAQVNLKREAAAQGVHRLVDGADILIEGFRPGVMERLGFAPEDCLISNRKLVYARLTGWGQVGRLSSLPGHDLNFVALSGVLHSLGRAGGPPTPPMNLLGNFAGGTFFTVIGILAALHSARETGVGQQVDSSMLHGSAYLASSYFSLLSGGQVSEERGTNLVDTGSALYEVYECADGRYISIAAMEVEFRAEFAHLMGVELETKSEYRQSKAWKRDRQRLQIEFKRKGRDEWCEFFEGHNVCIAPVLAPTEAPLHPHNIEAQVFYKSRAGWMPRPGPNFSATPTGEPSSPVFISEAEMSDLAVQWEFAQFRRDR